MSLSLDAQNIEYDGVFLLEFDDLLYNSAGKSTAPESYYSLQLGFDGEREISSAYTDSGSLAWQAQMDTSAGDLNNPQKIFTLAASQFVNNGLLRSYYGNDKIKASENVATSDAYYKESILIYPDRLMASGSGLTYLNKLLKSDSKPETESLRKLNDGFVSMSSKYLHIEQSDPSALLVDSNGQSSEGKSGVASSGGKNLKKLSEYAMPGFIHEIDVKGEDEWGWIDAAVIGNVVANWRFGLNAQPDDYIFGLNVQGAGIERANVLHMQADGSKIPLISLPPTVEIKSTTLLEEELSEYKKYVNDQTNEFYKEYPSSESIRPVSWYYMDQKAFINPIQVDGDGGDQEKRKYEYFTMGMRFQINEKEVSFRGM